MAASIHSILEAGDQGILVDVECQITNGLPAIIIVGSGNKAVDEAKERVKAAFASTKLSLPRKRITINLAPADVPKDGTGFDLAIAAAILTAQQPVPDSLVQAPLLGELGLDGEVRPVRGIIGKLLIGKQLGFTRFLIPAGNLQQAALVPGVSLLPLTNLKELAQLLIDGERATFVHGGKSVTQLARHAALHDFAEIAGQARAKRALEIAAAGAHNVLLSGPPGTGKSMLAKALPSILPPLTHDEILEATHLHSLASRRFDQLITVRPFRAPHHSASAMAIIGGGARPRPGEISLAHHGVLFLDELPEYSRPTLEALRQPLEDQSITIARAHDSVSFPAKFILVGTANPCPCGYHGSSKKCTCRPSEILHYHSKLSGPIMDRIDLYVQVDEVQHQALLAVSQAETSHELAKRITRARNRQRQRFRTSLLTNGHLTNRQLRKYAGLAEDAQELLNNAAARLGISARAYMRTLKVARTIADLEDSPTILRGHISEALQYRRPEGSL